MATSARANRSSNTTAGALTVFTTAKRSEFFRSSSSSFLCFFRFHLVSWSYLQIIKAKLVKIISKCKAPIVQTRRGQIYVKMKRPLTIIKKRSNDNNNNGNGFTIRVPQQLAAGSRDVTQPQRIQLASVSLETFSGTLAAALVQRPTSILGASLHLRRR